MKRLILITSIVLALSGYNRLCSQIYTQDASGKSSIIAPGSSINLDIAKEALSINWNNWQNLALDKRYLWGIAANGENEEGVANLFSEGKFVPTTRINGFVGFIKKLSTDSLLPYEYRIRWYRDTLRKLEIQLGVAINFRSTGDAVLMTFIGLNEAEKVKYKKEWRTLFNSVSGYGADDYIEALDVASKKAKEEEKDLTKARVFDAIKTAIVLANKNQLNTKGQYENLEAEFFKFDTYYQAYRDRTYDKNLIFFLNGGVNSATFRLYDKNLSGTLSDQIFKNPYTNGFIDVGLNYDIGARWLIGGTIGYEKYTTFDSLDKSDVVLRTTTTIGAQSLIEDKKYTVYTGDFYKYDRIAIKFDIMRFGKISDASRYAWNVLYGRIWTPFGDKKPNGITNLGTAFNFYKKNGKFIGGIYCEAVDVGNKMGADTSFPERISLGIVATFSFNTIVGYHQKKE